MRRKKMIQLGICDEDLKITKILCHMIETQYAGQIKVYTWKSAEEMLSWQKEYKTVSLDIIIIDLSMENGISFAEKLNALSRRLKIIFITEQLYAVSDIFRISPIYLLAKPVSVIKLVEAIEQAIEKIRWEERKEIILQSRGCVYRLKINYISYIENADRRLLIHYNDEIVTVYMKLSQMEEKLNSFFLRCHHSFLVNMNFVKTFSPMEIILTNGTVIPVSRPKRDMAREQYLAFLGEEGKSF